MSQNHESQIAEIIFRAIDEVNGLRPEGQQLPKDMHATLFGDGGHLDSLGLVELIVAVEEAIDDDIGVRLAIADEKAISQKQSPFRDMQSFVSYVQGLLEEAKSND